MSGVNVQISMTNLTQIDRHQNDIHRVPVTHQEQNSAAVQDAAMRRISMPIEPDTIEKKTIDTENEKRDASGRKMKKHKSIKKKQKRNVFADPDHMIDLTA